MAVIFLLGPGMLGEEKGGLQQYSPMDVRRDMARTFRAAGHKVILMEDEPDGDVPDIIQKFDRLLRTATTDVVCAG